MGYASYLHAGPKDTSFATTVTAATVEEAASKCAGGAFGIRPLTYVVVQGTPCFLDEGRWRQKRDLPDWKCDYYTPDAESCFLAQFSAVDAPHAAAQCAALAREEQGLKLDWLVVDGVEFRLRADGSWSDR